MSVRVRFAPSPTGYLHIGGARTALYNYLFAKAQGGVFVLRVEDTDQERSSKEYELKQLEDLKWLGIEYDEGPDKPGKFGPYRQSERTEIYKKYAEQLVDEGKAFYCFCSDELLEAKKNKAKLENRDPHYDGTCHHISNETARERIADGEKATIRFKALLKPITFKDHVRGEVTFPEKMVGDFVIQRSNGMPVYNFCCVIDDWLMKITHVIRGEDHLNNSVRQIMVYEALGAKQPEFAHVSLLIGKDRQKLSKRHGATSVKNYKDDSYLPDAMVNYLCLLGWSHPDELEVFKLEQLQEIFTINRFSKAPAVFDVEKFKYVNGQHLKDLSDEVIVSEMKKFVTEDSPFLNHDEKWQVEFVSLFKEKVRSYADFNQYVQEVYCSEFEIDDALEVIYAWENTSAMKEYLKDEINKVKTEYVSEEEFKGWQNHLKKEMKIKGKFLFMGMRGVLTGKEHGSDLSRLIPLTPTEILKKRLNK